MPPALRGVTVAGAWWGTLPLLDFLSGLGGIARSAPAEENLCFMKSWKNAQGAEVL